MKKISIVLVLIVVYAIGKGQGLRFESKANWPGVLKKAKLERKLVFVDVYATWCAPCREMDLKVYVTDSVGEAMNDRFISYKVQVDTNKKDARQIVKKYKESAQMAARFKPDALPTFLIFNSEGKLINRGYGYKSVSQFLKFVAESRRMDIVYSPLISKFYKAKLEFERMPLIARRFKELGDMKEATVVAKAYIEDYLSTLSIQEFCTKPNIEIVAEFSESLSTRSLIFKRLVKYGAEVDSMMNIPNYANNVTLQVLNNEIVRPEVLIAKEKGREPNWLALHSRVVDFVGVQGAEQLLIPVRERWYKEQLDYKNYTKYLVLRMEKLVVGRVVDGDWGALPFNNAAFDIYNYSSDTSELNKALSWANIALGKTTSLASAILDTKACILYKLGRVDEAIAVEEKAIALVSPQEGEDMRRMIIRMRKREKTWIN